MTARNGFDRRDYYTCAVCDYCEIHADETGRQRPWCRRAEDWNRWDLFQFGCGDYASTDTGGCELPVTLALWGVRS